MICSQKLNQNLIQQKTNMFLDWESINQEQVVNHIRELKKFFKDDSRWLSWPEAQDDKGNTIDPFSEKAFKYSLMGASIKIAKQNHPNNLVVAGCLDCATREYLNTLCDDKLNELTYKEEISVINKALEKLK